MGNGSFKVRLGLLALVAVVIAFLARPHPRDTYGSGLESFHAHFASAPVVSTVNGTSVGLGGFPAGSFHTIVRWTSGFTSVWLATLRSSPLEVSSYLKRSSNIFHGTYTQTSHGQVVRFVESVAGSGHGVPRWSAGVIQVRGSKFYYALGGGSTKATALKFVNTFKVVQVAKS